MNNIIPKIISFAGLGIVFYGFLVRESHLQTNGLLLIVIGLLVHIADKLELK